MRSAIAIICLLALPVVAEDVPNNQTEKQFHCDPSKRYCKQMENCAEARYYLAHCGRKHFDRNRDGIPCENVCGEQK